MKIVKIISYAVVLCAAASFTAACGWFQNDDEADVSQFWVPDDAPGSKRKAGNGAGNGSSLTGFDDPELKLNGLEGREGDGSAGEWGSTLPDGGNGAGGEAYAEGFGARIPNVNFQPVYFLFDQQTILASEEEKLLEVVQYLRDNPDAGVVIEGNCDERGTTEYNRGLGEKRAIAAKKFLLAQGIAEERMKTVSYGKERPAVQGANEQAFKLNRRDELVPVYLLKK